MKLPPMTCCAAIALLLAPSAAFAAPISLSAFFADPGVEVSSDGASATLTEDESLGIVRLVNNPGLGNPAVIIPGVDSILSFHFDFHEAVGGNDEFRVFFIDAANGQRVGPSWMEFFNPNSSDGRMEFDLTPLVGMTVGLQFQLSSLPGDANRLSTLTISDLDLKPIPEPASVVLLLSGLSVLAARRLKPRRSLRNATRTGPQL